MRHHSSNRKFGREMNQRSALLRSLSRNLINEGRITTTLAKAKSLRPFVEKLITKARVGTLASRRLIISRVQGDKETKILMDDLAKKYKSRNGGYIRIIKVQRRKLDSAPMAMIEFV
ncbi:MAG TPA: 50S ribosomal protein L17 [Candidatus Paceibacterota bacterium]